MVGMLLLFAPLLSFGETWSRPFYPKGVWYIFTGCDTVLSTPVQRLVLSCGAARDCSITGGHSKWGTVHTKTYIFPCFHY